MPDLRNTDESTLLLLGQFQDELENELASQSDRGLAIIGLSGIDSFLEIILRDTLVSDASRSLFEGNGPLGSLSSKTAMAFALGLISADERREIDILRRIRNEFAHSIIVKFEAPVISDRCGELKLSERLYSPRVLKEPLDLNIPDSLHPKDRFAASISVMLRVLFARRLSMGDRCQSPFEYEHAEDPDHAIVTAAEPLFERYIQTQLDRAADTRALPGKYPNATKADIERAFDLAQTIEANARRGRLGANRSLANYHDRVNKIRQARAGTGSEP